MGCILSQHRRTSGVRISEQTEGFQNMSVTMPWDADGLSH